jgi:hypothetical protein
MGGGGHLTLISKREKNKRARSRFCDLLDCEAAQCGVALSDIKSQAPPRNPDNWYELLRDPAIDGARGYFVARSNITFLAQRGCHSQALRKPGASTIDKSLIFKLLQVIGSNYLQPNSGLRDNYVSATVDRLPRITQSGGNHTIQFPAVARESLVKFLENVGIYQKSPANELRQASDPSAPESPKRGRESSSFKASSPRTTSDGNHSDSTASV